MRTATAVRSATVLRTATAVKTVSVLMKVMASRKKGLRKGIALMNVMAPRKLNRFDEYESVRSQVALAPPYTRAFAAPEAHPWPAV